MIAQSSAGQDFTVAEVLFRPPTAQLKFLPEGPIDLGDGRFSWVGIQHGASAKFGSLNIYDFHTQQNSSYILPGRPGFARPTDQPTRFLIGAERQLGYFDLDTGLWETLCSGVDAEVENTIINDATTWHGNVVFGCKDLEFKTQKAGLYLYRAADKQLIALRQDQICSNGKAIVENSNGTLSLLDIDTPTRKIVRYQLDIAGGKASEAETVIDLSSATGFPDGMVLTPSGQSVIVSFYNPDPAEYGQTQQFNLRTGQLEFTWRTPASPQNTCPLIMKLPDGSTKLIITTAVEHMPEHRQAEAVNSGCLFIANLPN